MNSLFQSGNKVSFFNGNEDFQAAYDQSYKFDNFEFSTHTGNPFHAVMWIDNSDGNQQNEFSIKVEGEPRMSMGKISTNNGKFRGRNTFAGNAFTMTYAVFQLSYDDPGTRGTKRPSICELYYVIESNDKWDSEFDGNMDINFGNDEDETSNSVSVSKDTKNAFFGYTLLSKNGKVQRKDLRKVLRSILRVYSDVDVNASSAGINKRDTSDQERSTAWWKWW